MEQMGVKQTVNKISVMPIRDKMARYEAFLSNNSDELEKKHGIPMSNKRTFIQNVIQQQQLSSAGNPNMMMMQQQQQDNSFEEEMNPMQQQMQNRFHMQ
jgi:hypothetical protein